METQNQELESRYSDALIGAHPVMRNPYQERSPVSLIEHLSRPMVFFRGLEEPFVWSNQTQLIVGELVADFYFYSRIFHFEPAHPVDPVEIENLRTSPGAR